MVWFFLGPVVWFIGIYGENSPYVVVPAIGIFLLAGGCRVKSHGAVGVCLVAYLTYSWGSVLIAYALWGYLFQSLLRRDDDDMLLTVT